MEDIKVEDHTVEVFMGGKLKAPEHPATVEELASWLERAAIELRSWSSDASELDLAEVHFDREGIDVTLKDGITQ